MRLAGLSLGAYATILRTAALALVHSCANCCAPVWCRSAHTRFIRKPINNALRRVIGCPRPNPTDKLVVLAGIQLTGIRRQRATLSLARRAQELEHLIHKRLVSPSFGHLRQLKLRHLFVLAALEQLNNLAQSGTSVAEWADYK